MVSFITWVNNDKLYQEFKESVHFKAEFISLGQECRSLAQAYNKGTSKATGDILVYIHQDVRLHCEQFEGLVQKALEDPKTGFAGPIGNILPSTGPWWAAGRDYCRGIVYGMSNGECNFGFYDGPARQLDGLMLCTRHKFPFPEQLPGIHFLDLWVCALAERKGFTNRIFTFGVTHLSAGSIIGKAWRNNKKLFMKEFYPPAS